MLVDRVSLITKNSFNVLNQFVKSTQMMNQRRWYNRTFGSFCDELSLVVCETLTKIELFFRLVKRWKIIIKHLKNIFVNINEFKSMIYENFIVYLRNW